MKKLAVLMPTYNAALYLQESIDSVLNQTFTDFDFYIYDDCSTDNTHEIISNYKDKRIFYRKNEANYGIAKTLNLGLLELLPNYEFIARMDADDWCYPERFEMQIAFMYENKDIVLNGTQAYFFKNIHDLPFSGWQYPLRHNYIYNHLLFSCSFAHPTIIFRSSFMILHKLKYNESIQTCEDYELWTQIIKKGLVANMPDFLMKIRILENSNHRSPKTREKHIDENATIISEYWLNFGVNLTPKQVKEFYFENEIMNLNEFVSNIKRLIESFNEIFNSQERYFIDEDRAMFRYLLARKILSFWKRSRKNRLDFRIWYLIVSKVKFIKKTKLIKSLIR
jgi:glycosyltransferase involved in cell wall biosynthesis